MSTPNSKILPAVSPERKRPRVSQRLQGKREQKGLVVNLSSDNQPDQTELKGVRPTTPTSFNKSKSIVTKICFQTDFF